jgi:3-hydroxymyristoyl/3-hydroxydecanoyl-(acyl carrier protein) dehydratase
MTNLQTEFPSGRLWQMLGETARRSSGLHAQFLQQRQNSLNEMKNLLSLQIQNAFGQTPAAARSALFDARQLDEFGVGRISRCLGPTFGRYDDRQIPRIPNGDLKMMSRITAVQGEPGDFTSSAAVTAEYDVPVDAWYFRDRGYPAIPYSLLMEIALQPCGFLSAYLDTYALVPYGRFHFRNLDGSARLLARIDTRGQTITTRARLLNSATSGGTVIQKYAFSAVCNGETLYAGESTFGYFSVESMANQMGLDGGRPVAPWLRSEGAGRRVERVDTRRWQTADPGQPKSHLPRGKMHFLDEVSVVRDGGRYGKGYLYAARPVDPRDWFYPFHFYQDPVMPGSLGVEAVLEAMEAYALSAGLGSGLRSPHFDPPVSGQPMTWRYRGQITPRHKKMELEVHLKDVEQKNGRMVLTGDASMWVDGLRIYELNDSSIGMEED